MLHAERSVLHHSPLLSLRLHVRLALWGQVRTAYMYQPPIPKACAIHDRLALPLVRLALLQSANAQGLQRSLLTVRWLWNRGSAGGTR